jgi:maltooligosyltrehalose trehalohydrolase
MNRCGVGSSYMGDGRCRFRVWAPYARRVEVRILSPGDRFVPLKKEERGYYHALLDDVHPGSLYTYRLDGSKERPDPASRYQPEGVHGPSQIVDPRYPWRDGPWHGLPLREYILYELHVGTFSPEGTFDGAIPYLDALKDLGVTVLELMPVAQFPGSRNWGYDGVFPFAVQNSYGGPEGLKRLIDACHQTGLGVVMDVVYNHLGPEGNVLWDYGPYFTDRYKTPWSSAVNFDGPHSDEVRSFFIENALYWIRDFRIDALRIDAVHAIFDFSARHFLEELAVATREEAERGNRRIHLIAESALNDTRLIRSRELGGFGLDAQWNDDFHHALHALLTGERSGYYRDFGRLEHLAKAFCEGFVYSGQYSAFRMRRHGNSSRDIPAQRFVVFTQNHDQVGNRMKGERLSSVLSFEEAKLAAGLLLLNPFIPLLFMGEEYGEKAPFPYFISHRDPDLIEAVREGRRKEFAAFRWGGEPPDPQDEKIFQSAKLERGLSRTGRHRTLLGLYKRLIRLRKSLPPLRSPSKQGTEVVSLDKSRALFVRRRKGMDQVAALFYFGKEKGTLSFPLPEGEWTKILDSADTEWEGPGGSVPENIRSGGEAMVPLSPKAFVLFTLQQESED